MILTTILILLVIAILALAVLIFRAPTSDPNYVCEKNKRDEEARRRASRKRDIICWFDIGLNKGITERISLDHIAESVPVDCRDSIYIDVKKGLGLGACVEIYYLEKPPIATNP